MATLIYRQTEEGLEQEKVDPLQLWNYLANGWFLNPECTDDGKTPNPEAKDDKSKGGGSSKGK